ncbi:hypothetical protein O6H91_05G093000 [Diphasiastrum complanatum]|uniref:Uncharacterized protein n=1 Tax=Diphasiastrum complanatum TaxID=34168 RepID=A0ACC2DR13_DIPCM|nr:hypothetical protein O6H91_05G093000 [Diphasiastrum complanatum]
MVVKKQQSEKNQTTEGLLINAHVHVDQRIMRQQIMHWWSLYHQSVVILSEEFYNNERGSSLTRSPSCEVNLPKIAAEADITTRLEVEKQAKLMAVQCSRPLNAQAVECSARLEWPSPSMSLSENLRGAEPSLLKNPQ